ELLVFPTNNLVTGDNVLAVEVHQVNATSSDDVFGLSLSAIQFGTNVATQTPSLTNITQTAQSLLGVTTTSWHWDNSGVDQGTAWRAPAFNDATWNSGFG